MNQRGSVWLVWGVFLTLCLVAFFFLYALFFGPSYDSLYQEAVLTGHVANPMRDLSMEQAQTAFSEDFVYSLLISLRAYNLHATPHSLELPELEVVVDEQTYTALIYQGRISVRERKSERPDIRLITSREEVIRLLEEPSLIPESFERGDLRFEKLADGSTLLFKGYFKVYPSLVRGSMSGNVIRSYFSS